MKYVIRRNEDGKFVTREGSKHSYTRHLNAARRFPTKRMAETEKCGNEIVIKFEEA